MGVLFFLITVTSGPGCNAPSAQLLKTVSQGRTHSSTLLRDNDMIRKWEDVTTTDTFTMYYASVFRGS